MMKRLLSYIMWFLVGFVIPVFSQSNETDPIMAASDMLITANGLRDEMKLDEADIILRQAADTFEKYRDWEGYFKAKDNLTRNLLQQSRFDEAKSICDSVIIGIQEKLGKKHVTLASFYNLLGAIRGMVYGDNAGALELHKSAVKAVEGLSDTVALRMLARSNGAVGMVYSNLGKYDSALVHISEEMQLLLRTDGPKSRFLAFSYQDLAELELQQGNIFEAEQYLLDGISLLKNAYTSDHDFIARFYVDLGKVYHSMHRYPEAIEYFDFAIEEFQNSGRERIGKFYALTSKGETLVDMGRPHEAIVEFDSALTAIRRISPEDELAIAAVQLGMSKALAVKGDVQAAIISAKNAANKFERNLGKTHIRVIQSMIDLGALYREHGQLELAEEYFNQALYLLSDKKDQGMPLRARVHKELAKLHQINGRVDSAIQHLSNGLKIMQPLENGSPLTIELNRYKGELISDYKSDISSLDTALVYYSRSIQGIKSLSASHANQSRGYWIESVFPVYEEMMSILYIKDSLERDQHNFERALNLSEINKSAMLKYHMQDVSALSFGQVDSTISEDLQDLKGKINLLEAQLSEVSVDEGLKGESSKKEIYLQSKLIEYKNEYQLLQRKIEKEYPIYFDIKYSFPEISLDDIQHNLKPGEVIYEYFYGQEYLYAFAIFPRSVNWTRWPIENIESEILEFKEWCQNPNSPNLRSTTYKKLYSELIFKLAAFSSYHFDKIRIIPDGPLCLIPFEALPIPAMAGTDSFTYLINRYVIYYGYSINDFSSSNKVPESNYLGIAPMYQNEDEAGQRQKLSNLEFNEDEVEFGANLFKGECLIGERATRSTFLEFAPKASVLHLAMHAEMNEEQPFRSNLIFTNSDDHENRLYLNELFNLKLNASLAVLSACNTGSGRHLRGDGLQSLSRGFLYSGVPNIITSLWTVNDRVTKDIISNYFSNIKRGQLSADALRQAKLDYIEQTDKISNHPFYWAPLVYVGSDEAVVPISGSNDFYVYLIVAVALLVLVVYIRRKR